MHVVFKKNYRETTLEGTEKYYNDILLKSWILIFHWSTSRTTIFSGLIIQIVSVQCILVLCISSKKQMWLFSLRWMRNKLLHKTKVNVILYMPLNWYIYSSRFFVCSPKCTFYVTLNICAKTLCKNHDHKSGDRKYTVCLKKGCLYSGT